jgi:predicted GNAT family N-acyltransferase
MAGENSQSVAVKEVLSKEDLERCFEIRRVVFMVEQAVPEEEEYDGLDKDCLHFMASLDDKPVGTARLRITTENQAKAERVAVYQELRGSGVGRLLMEALEHKAQSLGHQSMLLSSQTQAIPFYERIGYEAYGDIFMDAGIPHRWMRKALAV